MPHNNGMHPTPHQRVSHVSCVGARVMPGVRRYLLIEPKLRHLGHIQPSFQNVPQRSHLYLHLRSAFVCLRGLTNAASNQSMDVSGKQLASCLSCSFSIILTSGGLPPRHLSRSAFHSENKRLK
jgi:hypothetical protein